ncbi:hypothetical protein CYMTET_29114 [Cymbomonas tetramitiformis]|uniref:Uncharacterized protein n=1 Tax=Cymbomonas tetramitiformis TaxID=36881 RepID=A0AAE0BTP4_9CHLO|nr:hypothetical protein CYMTET_47685 [Cymbomonas tetramitiformis]KAK3262010.1 hypothetical protein CYMTET_29114 [Cymbomonas tetramitiformis]
MTSPSTTISNVRPPIIPLASNISRLYRVSSGIRCGRLSLHRKGSPFNRQEWSTPPWSTLHTRCRHSRACKTWA